MTYYVIQIIAEDGYISHVTKGEFSEFDVSSDRDAKRFNSISEAESALQSRDFTKRNIYSDGSSSPPRAIWSALGINYQRPESSGIIQIVKHTQEIVSSVVVSDKLIKFKD